jgi:hypothetical protein
MRLPSLLLALTLCCAAEQRDVYYQGPLHPDNTMPTFDKGYLMVFNSGRIDLYAPGRARAPCIE